MKPNRGSIVTPEIPKRLQAALMRIRGDHPFFGTLALFAEFRVTDDIDTAATDGRVLWFNPEFVDKQGPPSSTPNAVSG